MKSALKSISTLHNDLATVTTHTKMDTEASEPSSILQRPGSNFNANIPLLNNLQTERMSSKLKVTIPFDKKDSMGSIPSLSLRKISKMEMKLSLDDPEHKSASPIKTQSFFHNGAATQRKKSKKFSIIQEAGKEKKSKYWELEKLDEKVENDQMYLKALDSDSVWNSLENFAFRGSKNAIFNINNFDTQFNRTSYANKNSFHDYYKKYTTHRELVRKNVIKKETPSFAFIREIKTSHKVPFPMGLLKKKGDENELSLVNCSVGNEFANILAKSIVHSEVNHVRKLDLELNRLTLEGVNELFNTLKLNRKTVTYLRKLNLSNNDLSGGLGESLSRYISEGDCHLKEIILENTCLNDDSLKALSSTICKHLENDLSVFNIGRNSITDLSAVCISEIATLCDSLKVLQLQANMLTNKAGALIIRAVQKNKEMKFLDISWNKLGDDLNIEPTRDEIYKSSINPMRTEYRNYDIKEFSQTMSMKFKDVELPTNPNEKKPKPGKVGKANSEDYMRALKFQKNIKLAPIEVSECAKALGELFKDNSNTLVHLNISNNNFNYLDCSHIAETVKQNQTILGIHVEGNQMTIDQLGFIFPISKPDRAANYYANSQITYNSLYDKEEGILIGNSLLKSDIPAHIKIKKRNNCWICEGWRETAFVFDHDPAVIGPDKESKRDAKIYLEIDQWAPYEMNYVVSDNKSIVYRMCPPCDNRFFYTLDNKIVENFASNEVEILRESVNIELDTNDKCEAEEEAELQDSFLKTNNKNFNSLRSSVSNFNNTINNTSTKLMKLAANFDATKTSTLMRNSSIKESIKRVNTNDEARSYRAGDELLSANQLTQSTTSKQIAQVSCVGKIYINHNFKNLDSLWIKHLNHCHPRPRKDEEFIARPRTPWSFPISIWAKQFYYEYEGENEESFIKAFTYDFNRCNFAKDLKNDTELLESLKEYLRSLYKKIIIAYKIISSQSNPIWQIGNSAIIEFLNKANGLLSTSYPQSFMNLKMQSVKSCDSEETRKKNKNIPEGIVRHQLMNLLVKVAIDKYVNNLKQFKNPMDAVKYSFENHYNYSLDIYEDPQEWRKSRYYNEYTDNFVQAHLPLFFAIYKSWSTKKDTGKKEKFMILDDFHSLSTAIVDKDCPVREIDLYFNQAIQLQENEVDFDRHYYLLFPEFLEAFCRVIDKASLGNSEGQDLNVKLDFIRERLQALIANTQEMKPVKEKFLLPQKKDLGLYEFDNNSQFYREILFPESSSVMQMTYSSMKRKSTKLAKIGDLGTDKLKASRMQIQEEADVMKTISENLNTNGNDEYQDEN